MVTYAAMLIQLYPRQLALQYFNLQKEKIHEDRGTGPRANAPIQEIQTHKITAWVFANQNLA